MKIEINENIAKVFTPYDGMFVKRVKQIGGAKWNGIEKCWTVPSEFVDTVRTIMEDVYGYTDISDNETISVKVNFNERVVCDQGPITLFGKTIAQSFGRDSEVKFGDDVAFIRGKAFSSGSRNNWQTVVEMNSEVLMTHVNKIRFEKEKKDVSWDISISSFNEVEHKFSIESLLKEKERLLKRLEEIDRLLEKESKI